MVQQCVWTTSASWTGRHYPAGGVSQRAGCHRMLSCLTGLRGRATARIDRDWLNRRDQDRGAGCAPYRPFRYRRCSMRCRERAPHGGAGSHQGAGRRWRAAAAGCGKSALIDGLARPYLSSGCPCSVARYGLFRWSSLHNAMCAAVFEELACIRCAASRFTVGIVDDVSGLSSAWHPIGDLSPPAGCGRCSSASVLTAPVGANKNSIKIIGSWRFTPRAAFVYDSKVGLMHRLPPALWP